MSYAEAKNAFKNISAVSSTRDLKENLNNSDVKIEELNRLKDDYKELEIRLTNSLKHNKYLEVSVIPDLTSQVEVLINTFEAYKISHHEEFKTFIAESSEEIKAVTEENLKYMIDIRKLQSNFEIVSSTFKSFVSFSASVTREYKKFNNKRTMAGHSL